MNENNITWIDVLVVIGHSLIFLLTILEHAGRSG